MGLGRYGKTCLQIMSRAGWPALVSLALVSLALAVAGCSQEAHIEFDILIVNGLVYSGENSEPQAMSLGTRGDRIEFVGSLDDLDYSAKRTIDATGNWVIPGFIDPHSHDLDDILVDDVQASLNNLAQGVTTVFYGNDGYGSPYIEKQFKELGSFGSTLNVALFAGHGAIRSMVMERANRKPTERELGQMKALLGRAMAEGALGLSTGLFYVPGTFADTDEIVELARVAASYGGIYESHIRDESNYSIGLMASVEEVIEIARQAKMPVHIAHIKALGVDLWGESAEIIELVQKAREEGLNITADQYPWLASGVKIHKALVPAWVLEGTEQSIRARLEDPALLPGIKSGIAENMRRRGGPDSLLVVISADSNIEGMTLAEIATAWALKPVDAVLKILSSGVLEPWTRVASFNMNEGDVEAFMSQPWVMTSSDGTDGHPRKYASFPQKHQQYVVHKPLLKPEEFIHRSSALVAETFSIPNRGYLRAGYFADIAILDPANFRPGADFANWNIPAEGVEYLLVNGALVIEDGELSGIKSGRALKPAKGL